MKTLLDQLEHAVQIVLIKNFKKPVIHINPKDLNQILNYVKKTVTNFKKSKKPTYRNIPFKKSDFIKRGTFYITEQK